MIVSGVVGIADAEMELERRAYKISLAAFSQAAWAVVEPEVVYQHNWHIDVISSHLEALFFRSPIQSGPNKGKSLRNIVINIPPRHMKSRLASVFFPVWCWLHDPGHQFFYTSYSQGLSHEHAAECMKIINSEWYQERWGPTGNPMIDNQGYVRLGNKRKVSYFTTSRGGARQASSVMGKVTGAGGDILVTDDPHNMVDVESDLKMDRVIIWWSKAMASRGNNPKTFCRLVVMQRLSESDLSGWCINEGYELLKIPARYEGEKSIGCLGHEDPRIEIGQPMWAGRFDDEELLKLEEHLGPDSAGQLQQRPAPAGGAIFPVDRLRVYGRVILNALLQKSDTFQRWITTWDFAQKGDAKGKGKRSFTCGQVWALRGSDVFLIDQIRIKGEFLEQYDAVKRLHDKWPRAVPIRIEGKANGPAICNALANVVPGLEEYEPVGSKTQRARAIAPFFRAQNVWVPHEDIAPWIKDWIHEHELFPNSAFKDQVDCTSDALGDLLLNGYTDVLAVDGRLIVNELDNTLESMRAESRRNRSRMASMFGDDPDDAGARKYTGSYPLSND